MSGRMRRACGAVFALVLVFSVGRIGLRLWDYQYTELARQQARAQADGSAQTPPRTDQLPAEGPDVPDETFLPPDEHMVRLLDMDLSQLHRTNPDVLGWITIPGTQLDYPFLQGEDNQYYLQHTWQGKPSAAGSVFLECKVSPDFSHFNTIIYGHNMKNGSMFGSLQQYRTQSHYQDYPSIYVADDAGVRRYDIFAAFEAEVIGHTYRLDLDTPEKKQVFLDYSAARSVIQTGIKPTAEDSVITLSTCTGIGYDCRWVVQAVLAQTLTARER